MSVHPSWLFFLLLLAAITSSCKKGGGPLIRMDDAADAPPPPASVAPANASLRPRTSRLGTGEAVPPFTLSDQKGALVSSAELISSKGAVLIFVPPDELPASRPAYDWARRYASLMKSRGVELLLVTPERVNKAGAIAERENLHAAVLSDPASWVARAFGVYTRQAGEVTSPATFVLGSDGRIQLSTNGLPQPEQALMAAETLPGKREKSYFLP